MEYRKNTVKVLAIICDLGQPVSIQQLSNQLGLLGENIYEDMRLLVRDKLIDQIANRGWVINQKGEDFLFNMARREKRMINMEQRYIDIYFGEDRWGSSQL